MGHRTNQLLLGLQVAAFLTLVAVSASSASAKASNLVHMKALIPDRPSENVSHWAVCREFDAAGRDAIECHLVEVSKEGVNPAATQQLLTTTSNDEKEPPSAFFLTQGAGACDKTYRQLRTRLGRPRDSASGSKKSNRWDYQGVVLEHSCESADMSALSTYSSGSPELVEILRAQARDSRSSSFRSLINQAGDSVLESIDEFSRRLGPIAANDVVKYCASLGVSDCQDAKDLFATQEARPDSNRGRALGEAASRMEASSSPEPAVIVAREQVREERSNPQGPLQSGSSSSSPRVAMTETRETDAGRKSRVWS